MKDMMMEKKMESRKEKRNRVSDIFVVFVIKNVRCIRIFFYFFIIIRMPVIIIATAMIKPISHQNSKFTSQLGS